MHGIAGDVFAALAEEKPDKHKDGTTKDKKSDFDRHRPASRKENKGIYNTKANRVQISASENDFFSKREITTRERIFGTIVWMTKEFAVKDELQNAAYYRVINNYNYADYPVNLQGAEQNMTGCEQNI